MFKSKSVAVYNETCFLLFAVFAINFPAIAFEVSIASTNSSNCPTTTIPRHIRGRHLSLKWKNTETVLCQWTYSRRYPVVRSHTNHYRHISNETWATAVVALIFRTVPSPVHSASWIFCCGLWQSRCLPEPIDRTICPRQRITWIYKRKRSIPGFDWC